MRAIVAALLLGACGVGDTDSETGEGHVCDEHFKAAECWDGCEAGERWGLDQGRLACIMEGPYLPERVRDEDSPFMDGFRACYPEAYADGWTSEGCEIPGEG